MSAQQIKVADFARLRKPFLRPRPYTVDKQFALLDLYTQEKVFEFLIGQQPVQVQEGEGMVTLMLPDMTAFFTIRHPDYGQLVWKVPDGPLHRKKRYHAQLLTDSPDKEFSIAHQWAVFRLQPAQAIVAIDSTMHRTLSGQIQVLLPVGSHSIRVEAPFYEELTDTFVISDAARLDMHISLHPLYSYLEVTSEVPGAEIRLDGYPIGKGEARSGRISPGVHELSLYRGPLCIHRSSVTLASGERRILSIGGETAENRSDALSANDTLSAHDAATSLIAHDEQPDSFHIRAFDDSTEIWVNREKVGYGSWKGQLESGIYAVSTRKDGMESRTQYVQVGGGIRQQVKMPTPYASYGWLSVSCNVVDAQVWLDGVPAGRTPCILPPMPASRRYVIKVGKEGYKTKEITVSPRGNDICDIKVKLKRK
ncbi:MAG: PEGA domain-containing protein [Bacteroidaceae bacterium]|nr:PEGA domain-containing protein [Bacteroidaceae bacterium]